MIRNLAAATLFLSLVPLNLHAQISIRIGAAPPPPVVEHYGAPPHPGWVWVPGFQRWDGHGYRWTHGHWAHPPHPGAVWVPESYEHRPDGFYFHAGYWR
jgi:hypothetical protein